MKKVLIIVGGLALIGGVVYFYSKIKKQREKIQMPLIQQRQQQRQQVLQVEQQLQLQVEHQQVEHQQHRQHQQVK